MFKLNKIFRNIVLGIYCFLIVIACITSAHSGKTSSNNSGFFINLFHFFPPYRFFLVRIPDLDSLMRKLIGHYTFFVLIGTCGTLIYLSSIKNVFLSNNINLFSGLFIAAFSEFIQIFAKDRGPTVLDVVINFQGYLSASMLIGTTFAIFRTLKNSLPISEFEISLCFNSLSAVISSIIFIFVTDDSRSINFCNKIFLFIFTASLIISFLMIYLNKKNISSKK